MSKVTGVKNQSYKDYVLKALETPWFVRSIFDWYEQFDSLYDIKGGDDLKKEVAAIENGKKGRVVEARSEQSLPYKSYKNEWDQRVAVYKPGKEKYRTTTSSIVRENDNFRFVEELTPGVIARNYLSHEGMVEQYIPFVDYKEARFLLLNPQGHNSLTQKYFSLFQSFKETLPKVSKQETPSLTMGCGYRSQKCFRDGEALECEKEMKNYSFGKVCSFSDLLWPILSNIWDMGYWKGEIDFEKLKYDMSAQDYNSLFAYFNTLEPLFQTYQQEMKNFGQFLMNKPSLLKKDIYHYLWVNYILDIQDPHADNVLVRSVQGQLRIAIIDTECSHGEYDNVNRKSPNFLAFLPFFRNKIDPSFKEDLNLQRSSMRNVASFDINTVKKRSKKFLENENSTFYDLYKDLFIQQPLGRPDDEDFPYNFTRQSNYLLYQALENGQTPLA